MRVLVVECFATDVAHDGIEGLFLAREHPYDAIVLDLLLPGMNGYKVCAALRQEGNWTPILMLTTPPVTLETGCASRWCRPMAP